MFTLKLKIVVEYRAGKRAIALITKYTGIALLLLKLFFGW
jgi:hypothetical protein